MLDVDRLDDCSRWEIGEEPQQKAEAAEAHRQIVADGRSGRNRNDNLPTWLIVAIVADGRSGRNRNVLYAASNSVGIVADGRSGRNRNSLWN